VSIGVRAPYLGVHIPPGAGAAILPARNVVTAFALTTASPRSTSRGSGNYYCQIVSVPLVAGKYTNIRLASLTFDEYVYIRRPDGTLFAEADNPGPFYRFTPDVTGDWTYEITTFNANVTGSGTVYWNRVPQESDLSFTAPGSYAFTLDAGWLATANTSGVRAGYFKLNQSLSPTGQITLNVTGETFDDLFYLMDSAFAVSGGPFDSGPQNRTVSTGVYYAICSAWGNVETGSATFVWSLT
jgi:hypothetical protein